MALGFLGMTLATAIATYGINKVVGAMSNYLSGGGQQQQSKGGPNQGAVQALEAGGVRSTILPSGATHEEFPTGPAELQKGVEGWIEELRAQPEAYPEVGQLLQQRQEIFGDPEGEYEQIARRMRKQFEEVTIPGLAERFAATGSGQRSGAFDMQLRQAGVDLEDRLGTLQAGMSRQDRQDKLQQLEFLRNTAAGRRDWQRQRQSDVRSLIGDTYGTAGTPAQPQQPGLGTRFATSASEVLANLAPILLKHYLGGASGSQGSSFQPASLQQSLTPVSLLKPPKRFGY